MTRSRASALSRFGGGSAGFGGGFEGGGFGRGASLSGMGLGGLAAFASRAARSAASWASAVAFTSAMRRAKRSARALSVNGPLCGGHKPANGGPDGSAIERARFARDASRMRTTLIAPNPR